MPRTTSSTSSTPATQLATSVAVRQGRTSSISVAGVSTGRDSPRPAALLLARLDPVPGAAEPVLERVLRPPAQLRLRARYVEGAAQHVAFARGLEGRWAVVAAHGAA